MTERLTPEERDRLRALLAKNDGAEAMQELLDKMDAKNVQGLPGAWKRPKNEEEGDE